MYQIACTSPVYCQVTDGQTGSRTKLLPMTYINLALASKLAGRMWDANYEGCGDDSFHVVNAGTFTKVYRPIEPSFDDMPF